MPRKRKATTKAPTIKPTIKTRPITKKELAASEPPAMVKIRCIHDAGKLVIGADKTPTKTRYEFGPGEVKPVNVEDYHYLLAMQTKPLGCCGGSMEPQKFFDEV